MDFERQVEQERQKNKLLATALKDAYDAKAQREQRAKDVLAGGTPRQPRIETGNPILDLAVNSGKAVTDADDNIETFHRVAGITPGQGQPRTVKGEDASFGIRTWYMVDGQWATYDQIVARRQQLRKQGILALATDDFVLRQAPRRYENIGTGETVDWRTSTKREEVCQQCGYPLYRIATASKGKATTTTRCQNGHTIRQRESSLAYRKGEAKAYREEREYDKLMRQPR